MKKQLLALAALAAVSGVAAAQSVTMYGVLDVSVKNTNASTNTLALGAGGLTPNIFGFKGSEDLGGGLKAGFDLQGHFAPQNGQIGLQGVSGAGGANGTLNRLNSSLFSRSANVSLSNELGGVTLGNQYSVSVLSYAATDPRGLRESFSGLGAWLVAAATTDSATQTATKQNGIGGVFLQNAVQVNTNVAGVKLGGSYVLGGVAGGTNKGRALDVGASTTVQGVTLSGGWIEANQSDSALTDYRMYSYGAAYTVGGLRVAANALTVKKYDYGTTAILGDILTIGAGGSYQVAPALSLNAAYYNTKNRSNATKSSNYVAGVEYSLSKRTTIYGQAAYVDGGTDWLATDGSNATVTQVGVRHTF